VIKRYIKKISGFISLLYLSAKIFPGNGMTVYIYSSLLNTVQRVK